MPIYSQTMTVVRRSVDELGRTQTTTRHDIRCRVETTSVRVVGPTGESYQEQYVIFAGAMTDVRVGDRITIDNNVTASYPEFAVKSVFIANGFGAHHLEIFV